MITNIDRTHYYSATVNGFYAYGTDVRKLPPDAVPVPYERYVALLAELSQPNKILCPDPQGYPAICLYDPQAIDDPEIDRYVAKNVLQETNQYVIDEMELGQAIPSDVKAARENARKILNTNKEK